MDAKPYSIEEAREEAREIARKVARIRSAGLDAELTALALNCAEMEQRAATLREYAAMKEAMSQIADHAADPHRCSCTVWGDCLDAIVSIARRFVDTRGEG